MRFTFVVVFVFVSSLRAISNCRQRLIIVVPPGKVSRAALCFSYNWINSLFNSQQQQVFISLFSGSSSLERSGWRPSGILHHGLKSWGPQVLVNTKVAVTFCFLFFFLEFIFAGIRCLAEGKKWVKDTIVRRRVKRRRKEQGWQIWLIRIQRVQSIWPKFVLL